MLILLVLMAGGCASTGDSSDPYAPIVISSAQENEILSPEEEAERRQRFEATLAAAREAVDDGRLREAMSIAQSGLEGNPPTDLRSALLSLRREVKAVLFSNEVVAGRCMLEEESFVLGSRIPVRIELTNVGDQPVHIPVSHRTRSNRKIEGESSSLFQVGLSVQDWDWHGSTVTQNRSLNIPLEDDIELAPGASWSTEVEVDTEDPLFRPELVIYRRLTVSGRLQPVEIRSGELQWFEAVPLESDRCEVLPPGIEKIREAPEPSLKRAIELSAETPAALNHVFFSSILLYAERPEEALDYLLDGLASDNTGLRQVSLTALRLVSGRSDLVRIDDWEAWAEGGESAGPSSR